MKMESVSSSLKNALKCMKILHQLLLQLIAELTRGKNVSQVSLHLYINKHFLSTILQTETLQFWKNSSDFISTNNE